MFEVGVVAHFEAAHSLRGNFGPASRLHGHTYRVEVAARGPRLRDDGTLCNISLLQQATYKVVNSFNYSNLDELAVFGDRNSTAEVVAQYLFEQISPQVNEPPLTALVVRVWESPYAYASYEGNLSRGHR